MRGLVGGPYVVVELGEDLVEVVVLYRGVAEEGRDGGDRGSVAGVGFCGVLGVKRELAEVAAKVAEEGTGGGDEEEGERGVGLVVY